MPTRDHTRDEGAVKMGLANSTAAAFPPLLHSSFLNFLAHASSFAQAGRAH